MTIRARVLILPLLLALACGGRHDAGDAPPSAEANGDPVAAERAAVSPTPAGPVAVLPDGTTIRLELAISPEEHAQGLMFRPSLPADRGMLFLFPEPHYPSFWMKDTWVPLDIVFLDQQGRVVEVVRDAPPCRDEPCPQFRSRHQAAAVLELLAGTATAHQLVAGDQIDFRQVTGYPGSSARGGNENEANANPAS